MSDFTEAISKATLICHYNNTMFLTACFAQRYFSPSFKYLFKISNKDTMTKPMNIVLLLLLTTLNKYLSAGYTS